MTATWLYKGRRNCNFPRHQIGQESHLGSHLGCQLLILIFWCQCWTQSWNFWTFVATMPDSLGAEQKGPIWIVHSVLRQLRCQLCRPWRVTLSPSWWMVESSHAPPPMDHDRILGVCSVSFSNSWWVCPKRNYSTVRLKIANSIVNGKMMIKHEIRRQIWGKLFSDKPASFRHCRFKCRPHPGTLRTWSNKQRWILMYRYSIRSHTYTLTYIYIYITYPFTDTTASITPTTITTVTVTCITTCLLKY